MSLSLRFVQESVIIAPRDSPLLSRSHHVVSYRRRFTRLAAVLIGYWEFLAIIAKLRKAVSGRSGVFTGGWHARLEQPRSRQLRLSEIRSEGGPGTTTAKDEDHIVVSDANQPLKNEPAFAENLVCRRMFFPAIDAVADERLPHLSIMKCRRLRTGG